MERGGPTAAELQWLQDPAASSPGNGVETQLGLKFIWTAKTNKKVFMTMTILVFVGEVFSGHH